MRFICNTVCLLRLGDYNTRDRIEGAYEAIICLWMEDVLYYWFVGDWVSVDVKDRPEDVSWY